MDLGFTANLEKIVNVILFLAKEVQPLYKTKLIKLLYLADEQSVKDIGVPITWLKYKVWKKGPVPKSLFEEISFYEGRKLSPAITLIKDDQSIRIANNQDPDLTVFSEYEIDTLNRTIANFGNLSGKELIEICHSGESLWFKAVKEHNLEQHWEMDMEISTSPFNIDFKDLLIDQPLKSHLFDSVKENIEFSTTLS